MLGNLIRAEGYEWKNTLGKKKEKKKKVSVVPSKNVSIFVRGSSITGTEHS